MFGRRSAKDEAGDESPGTSVDGTTGGPATPADEAAEHGRGQTAKKGRPTPRRRDQERAKGRHTGPVAAPVTRKEARARRKTAEAGMSREERKAHRADQRRARDERREAMMNGDDRYVLARDRGEVRRHVRDWVDTHRRLINYFMPIALFVVVFQLVPNPQLVMYGQMLFLALIAVIVVDGLLIGRAVNKDVAERFPDSDDRGLGLGWYAVMRATQPRMLRTPKPRLSPADRSRT